MGDTFGIRVNYSLTPERPADDRNSMPAAYSELEEDVKSGLLLSVVALMAANLLIVESSWGQALISGPGSLIQTTPLSDPNVNSFSIALGVRRYINSFTSYQFPDPDMPQSDPLSRLEWPWEQTVGVVKLGYALSGLELKFDAAATLFLPSFLKAQDSDWEDPNNPSQKTTFSEGKAKPRMWTFDGCVAFNMPSVPIVKAVLGYRAQQFSFTYADVLQGSIWDEDTQTYRPVTVLDFLPGPSIEFTEYYKHWYGGGILSTSLDLGFVAQGLASRQLMLKFQADYAYVKANNLDFHILRTPGPRFTAETTTGASWHLNLTTELRCGRMLAFSIEGDFMRICTKGSHHLTEPGQDRSWDGAKAWSEQKYVAASAILVF